MRSSLFVLPLSFALAGSACASGSFPQGVNDGSGAPIRIPTTATAAENPVPNPGREAPPASAPKKPAPFPAIHRDALANGLELAVVEAHALPLVQLRLVIGAGSADDGDLTGLSRLTALMLKDGGAGSLSSAELLLRVESLGANLGVQAQPDATILSLAVPKRHLDEALELLAMVVSQPRFDETELRKLKGREIERISSRAKSSGAWAASMLLYRELYKLPTRLHPYAAFDALPAEIEKLDGRSCRAFYKQHYTPKNARLVVAGDTDLEAAKAAAARVFGAWKGNDVAKPSPASPVPPEQLRIFVADRPGSAQSDIYFGMLGPSMRDDEWTHLAVADQILGGGVAGRLFMDVREQRSLAYSTRSSLGRVAKGPVPLTVYAGTQTAKTGLAVKALTEHLSRLASEAPSEAELEISRRYLADVLALQMETVGAVADMVAALDIFGLGDDYYDRYREALGAVTAEEALSATSAHMRSDHAVLVVAGDAQTIAPMLTHFGEVRVVDPENGFSRVKTLAANPNAPLEVERQPGQ